MTVRVPVLDLKAQFREIEGEIRAAMDRVLHSQQFILGPEVDAFERETAAYLGARHAVGVASGSDALALALMALGIGAGDCVLTTPMSYIATAESIWRVGARPVFVDVDPSDLNITPQAVEAYLETHRDPRLKAVIPVHLFGRPCDIEGIARVARDHGLAVIEDAAQAIGALFQGRKVGTFGEIGCFSFFPSKNLGGYGDGGLLVTERDDIAALLRSLRVHGSGSRRYVHDRMGMNSRLDALQAAILRVKLPYLDGWTARRREHARAYARAFEGSRVQAPPFDGKGRFDIFHVYVVRVPAREGLIAHLQSLGIQTTVHYPTPLHLQPCFSELGYRPGDLPEVERACTQVLSIPLYPELEGEVREEIAREIVRYTTEHA
jgi:dTDP-4-amino-4,6-dideoxygalactose transaminase